MKKYLKSFLAILLMLTFLCVNAFGISSETLVYPSSVTGNKQNENKMTASVSTRRWSTNSNSYIYKEDDKYITVDFGEELVVNTYDNDFKLLSSKILEKELDKFGGFYHAVDYNYVLFGSDNPDESDSAEVLRLVRYKKDFSRVDSGSVSNCFTVSPFNAGSASISECNEKIIIHTSRKRYKTEDGLNHQSQLTVIMDKKTLNVENYLGRFQSNHVSHSFNQFVKSDGDNFVMVDHGDAYPRSILLTEYSTVTNSNNKITLFEIPGEIGANCTGVTVGGLEISDTSYLVPINSVDHSKITEYDSFNMTGLGLDERNIILLIKEKNSDSNTKETVLTDYIDKGYLGSTPYIVKVESDKYAVLWQEFKYIDGAIKNNGLKMIFVDGQGNKLTDIICSDAILSHDCQPIFDGEHIVWYVNINSTNRLFFKVSVSEFVEGDVTFTPGDINADGTVNSSDALLTLLHSAGRVTLKNTGYFAGDVNTDFIINSTDALLILQYSVGVISRF